MRIERYDPATIDRLLSRPASREDAAPPAKVTEIVDDVRARGDAALAELTERLDGVELDRFEVSRRELDEAASRVPAETIAALERAASQIRTFHRALIPKEVTLEVSEGVLCRRRFTPIEKVGLYVPAGSAPLPSTALMLGIPAEIAGCEQRVVCSPPRPDGSVDPLTLVAARLTGVGRVFKLGGAQAIAALAYGTESVPRVDKIFGPGNAWVTAAKLEVVRRAPGIAIDSPAGPSEVMVVADRSARAAFVAADLLSQAEHDALAHAVLVTTSAELARETARELEERVAATARREVAAESLRGAVAITVNGLDEALDVVDRYAPEHLILQVEDPDTLVERIRHAGSVFLGPWTPEAVGDYASGTNHVLPTLGYARAYGGLGVESFMKTMTVQRLTPAGIRDIGPAVMTLAAAEGLDAHRDAVAVRLEALRAEEREP